MNTLFDLEFTQQHYQLQAEFTNHFNSKDHQQALLDFQNIIHHYYFNKKRSFSWRQNITPYRIVVSEIMLQQTQTDRVAQKFDTFIDHFPDFSALAQAPFHEVLRFWKGLGYNRRAMALQKIAQLVTTNHNGQLPDQLEILETFPSIGKATARSIVAFAFNQPTVFVETNIRTVFIYFFFKNQISVNDKDLEPLIAQTVNHSNPREWYYALMDYGVMLKKTVGNLCKLSAHYNKQSKFEGSDRQIRGMILQALLDRPNLSQSDLISLLEKEPARIHKIVEDLCNEGFVKKNDEVLQLI